MISWKRSRFIAAAILIHLIIICVCFLVIFMLENEKNEQLNGPNCFIKRKISIKRRQKKYTPNETFLQKNTLSVRQIRPYFMFLFYYYFFHTHHPGYDYYYGNIEVNMIHCRFVRLYTHYSYRCTLLYL